MAGPEFVIEVACATPEQQLVIELSVNAGTTVAQAIRLSGIAAHFAELDIDNCKVGIYSEIVSPDHQVASGDRVEIYRELLMSPREARLRRARSAKNKGTEAD